MQTLHQVSGIAKNLAEKFEGLRQSILDSFELAVYDDHGCIVSLDVSCHQNHEPKDPGIADEVWSDFVGTTLTRMHAQCTNVDLAGEYLPFADELLNAIGEAAKGLASHDAGPCNALVIECRAWMKDAFLSESINAKQAADQLYDWTQRWMNFSRQIVAADGSPPELPRTASPLHPPTGLTPAFVLNAHVNIANTAVVQCESVSIANQSISGVNEESTTPPEDAQRDKSTPVETKVQADANEDSVEPGKAKTPDKRESKRKQAAKLCQPRNSSSSEKCKSYLLVHHKYNMPGGLNTDPTTPTLIDKEGITSKASATRFFKAYFGGHRDYLRICEDREALEQKLKWLAGDVKPGELKEMARVFREDMHGE